MRCRTVPTYAQRLLLRATTGTTVLETAAGVLMRIFQHHAGLGETQVQMLGLALVLLEICTAGAR